MCENKSVLSAATQLRLLLSQPYSKEQIQYDTYHFWLTLSSGARSGKLGAPGDAEGFSLLKRDKDHTRSLSGVPQKEMESQKAEKTWVRPEALATQAHSVHRLEVCTGWKCARLGEPKDAGKEVLGSEALSYSSALALPGAMSLGKLLNTGRLACQ